MVTLISPILHELYAKKRECLDSARGLPNQFEGRAEEKKKYRSLVPAIHRAAAAVQRSRENERTSRGNETQRGEKEKDGK